MTELNSHRPLRVHVDLLKAIFSEIEKIATENEKEMPTTVGMDWSRKAWGIQATNMEKTFFFASDPSVFEPLHLSRWEYLEHVSVRTSYCFPLRDMIRIFNFLPQQEVIFSTAQDELLVFSSRGFQRLTSRKMRPKDANDLLFYHQRKLKVYNFLEEKEIPYSLHRYVRFDESHPIMRIANKTGLKNCTAGVIIDERIDNIFHE